MTSLSDSYSLRDYYLSQQDDPGRIGPSRAERQEAFLEWAASTRKALPERHPDDRLMCPLLFCRRHFDSVDSCLQHLRSCKLLPDGLYLCPFCLRPEQFRKRIGRSNSKLKRAVTFFKKLGRKESRPTQSRDLVELPLSSPTGMDAPQVLVEPPWNAFEMQAGSLKTPGIQLHRRSRFELDSTQWSELAGEIPGEELQSGDSEYAASEPSPTTDDIANDQSIIAAPAEAANVVVTTASPSPTMSPLSPVSSITQTDSSHRLIGDSPFHRPVHDILQRDKHIISPVVDEASQSLTVAQADGGDYERDVLPLPRSLNLDAKPSSDAAGSIWPSQKPPVAVTALSKMKDVLSWLQILNQDRTARLRLDSPVQAAVFTPASTTYLQGLDTVCKIFEGAHMVPFGDVIAIVDVALAVALDLNVRGRICFWPKWYEEVIQLQFLFEAPDERTRFLEVADCWWRPVSVPSSLNTKADDQGQRHTKLGDEFPRVKSLKETLVVQLCQRHINGT